MQLTDIIQPLSKSLQLCLWFDTKLKLICINVLIFRMASDSVVKYDRQRDSTRYLHIFLVKVYLAGKRIIEAVISLCCLNSIRNLQHHGCIENRRKIFFFAPGFHGNGKVVWILRHLKWFYVSELTSSLHFWFSKTKLLVHLY